MKQLFQLLALSVVVFLSGCSLSPSPHPGFASLSPVPPATSSAEHHTITAGSGPYTITVQAGEDTALEVCRFMELALGHYDKVLEISTTHTPALGVHLYHRPELYKQSAQSIGLNGTATAGFYSPAPPAGVHLLWQGSGQDHPMLTLAHEGFHQYAHEVLRPIAEREYSLTDWPAVIPYWLNEGLAQFFEAAVVNDTRIDPGRIHQARLLHLQHLLRRGRLNSFANTVARRYAQPFNADDYSVAWGITFALYHGLSPDRGWTGTNLLPSYIARLWELQSSNHATSTFAGADARLAQYSQEALAALLLAEGTSLAEWENSWKMAILSLQSDTPNGGLILTR